MKVDVKSETSIKERNTEIFESLKIDNLKKYYEEFIKLYGIGSLLQWDNLVYMPKGNAQYRGEQLAYIEGLMHKMITSKKMGKLLKKAEESKNVNIIDKAILRETRKEYDEETKVPQELVEKLAKARVKGYQTWVKAKKNNDFKSFIDILNELIIFKKERANYINLNIDPYNVMLDHYEPDYTMNDYDRLFKTLKPELIKLAKSIPENKQDILKLDYDTNKQFNFTKDILKGFDFNFHLGRQDLTIHPFTIHSSPTDTRITTKCVKNWLYISIFGTIHECGHALYMMNINKELHNTILYEGASYGFHEAQAKLLENIVGKSKDFWIYWYPKLKFHFRKNLKNFSLDDFYLAINAIKSSLIRIEADEITYNLHIILRYEIEKGLMNGSIDVSELPDVWSNKMDYYLDIIPPNDTNGVLQDVHWSEGLFGYFPTYVLGNLYASQIWNKILNKNPYIRESIGVGNYIDLFNFLKENVYQYGRIYKPSDLIEKATGEKLNSKYFVDYLKEKFYSIYK